LTRGSGAPHPAIVQKGPFDEHVEGLSPFYYDGCAFQAVVRPENFEQAALFLVLRRKPLVGKVLGKSERPLGEIGLGARPEIRAVGALLPVSSVAPTFRLFQLRGTMLS